MMGAAFCVLLRNGRFDAYASPLGPGSAAELRSASLSWGFARSGNGEALPRTPPKGCAPFGNRARARPLTGVLRAQCGF